jgi:hypothetical protein
VGGSSLVDPTVLYIHIHIQPVKISSWSDPQRSNETIICSVQSILLPTVPQRCKLDGPNAFSESLIGREPVNKIQPRSKTRLAGRHLSHDEYSLQYTIDLTQPFHEFQHSIGELPVMIRSITGKMSAEQLKALAAYPACDVSLFVRP